MMSGELRSYISGPNVFDVLNHDLVATLEKVDTILLKITQYLRSLKVMLWKLIEK